MKDNDALVRRLTDAVCMAMAQAINQNQEVKVGAVIADALRVHLPAPDVYEVMMSSPLHDAAERLKKKAYAQIDHGARGRHVQVDANELISLCDIALGLARPAPEVRYLPAPDREAVADHWRTLAVGAAAAGDEWACRYLAENFALASDYEAMRVERDEAVRASAKSDENAAAAEKAYWELRTQLAAKEKECEGMQEALESFTRSDYIKHQHPKRYAAAVKALATGCSHQDGDK